MGFRDLLRWARIEDENGQFSLTTCAFGVAVFCILAQRPVSLPELSAFALAMGGYHAKKIYRHRNEQTAMHTAREVGLARLDADKAVALAQRADQAEQLGDRLTSVEKKLAEILTPEMQDRIKNFFRRTT